MKSSIVFSPLKKQKSGRLDEVVEQYLLEKITRGEIAAGAKLPATAEMASQMGVNINSVQRALMRLSARGFLARKTNLGTFVRTQDNTPRNIFLLIGPSLREEICHFDRRLSRLIETELFRRNYNPIIYDGLDQILERNSLVGPRLTSRLLTDLTHFDPQGIIEQHFLSLRIPELVRNHPIVSFRHLAQGGDVCLDTANFYAEAVRAAVDHGRRKAILVLKVRKVSSDSRELAVFWKAAQTSGLNIDRILHIHDDQTDESPLTILEESLTQALQEWKKLPPGKRWDSIILQDDILMRTAAQCLLREGISVPDDILPISLVNEGIDLCYGLPVVGIETPLSQIATAVVDLLDIRLGLSTGRDLSPILLKGRVVTNKPSNRVHPSSLPSELTL